MKLRAKLAILLIATLITFVVFNLIVSYSLTDMLKIGKKAGYEIIANTLAEESITGSNSSP